MKKIIVYLLLGISLNLTYSQASNEELLDKLVKKTNDKYIYEQECSFFIKVKESDLYEKRLYNDGYTFCFYDEEEIFNDKVSYYIKLTKVDSSASKIKYSIEWINIEEGINKKKIEKKRRIKISKDL